MSRANPVLTGSRPSVLIEQNLSVATTVARRQLVMVAGRIFTETTAEQLVSDPEAQRRFLGVEPLTQTEA